MNQDLMSIGSRVRLERERKGWSQEKLAERADISTKTIYRVEIGQSTASDNLVKVCAALGVPFSFIQPERFDSFTDISDADLHLMYRINRLPEAKRAAVKAAIEASMVLAEF